MKWKKARLSANILFHFSYWIYRGAAFQKHSAIKLLIVQFKFTTKIHRFSCSHNSKSDTTNKETNKYKNKISTTRIHITETWQRVGQSELCKTSLTPHQNSTKTDAIKSTPDGDNDGNGTNRDGLRRSHQKGCWCKYTTDFLQLKNSATTVI